MARVLAFPLLFALVVACAAAQPLPGSAAARTPAHAVGDGLALFQPGVWIDWPRREVQVQTRVVLRSGALEFLACWPGKEHESIVRFEPPAAHVYQALGLVGLVPGHPPVFDPPTGRVDPPAGDLIEISFRWEQDGQARSVNAFEWLYEQEYGRPPLPRPWIFAGSLRMPDGTLSSDSSGVGIAVVDFPDSLICYSRRYSSRNSELWAMANTAAIPPQDTPVRLVLRPAQPRPRQAVLDFRGAVWVDGRYCPVADLADIVTLAIRLEPAYVQTLDVRGALRSDERRLRRELDAAHLPARAVHFAHSGPADQTATRPPGAPPSGD